MFSPPSVQLSPLVVRQRKFPLTLTVRKALLQSHGQFGPVACRELEELRKRTRLHRLILSWVSRAGNGRIADSPVAVVAI